MYKDYCILVNTCDNFEDCWYPFFKLFANYWPDYNGKIYLNTEYKDFKYPDLDIICTKVCEVNNVPRSKRATWSQCLKWALEQIDTDVLLYMQEDYFLKDKVKNDIVLNFVTLMHENTDIDCIHLTDQAVLPENSATKYDKLLTVKLKQKYRISCQTALWRKRILYSYLRVNENAWQFEKFGSKRAQILYHNFYVVNNNWIRVNKNEIIPYIFTGIVQGKWNENSVDLFKKNMIYVNFSNRGFTNSIEKKKTIHKLNGRISYFFLFANHLIFKIKLKCIR